MSGALGLGVLFLAAAILIHQFATRPLASFEPGDAALLAAYAGAVLVLTRYVVGEFRYRWTSGLWALLFGGLVAAGLAGAYVRRGDMQIALDRLIGEVSAGRVATTDTGEVVVARRADGSFTLAGRVNERDARFIFDTGASTVVLTAESAIAVGLQTAPLAYTVPVATANGRTFAAPVTLDSVSIGPIVERRILALVAKPGVLHENLLGMSFLERLNSYEVRGSRLILRPRGSVRS